jgi:hypothetical protein
VIQILDVPIGIPAIRPDSDGHVILRHSKSRNWIIEAMPFHEEQNFSGVLTVSSGT